MARLFARARGGRYAARLDPHEVDLLRGLVGDVVGLVRTQPAENAAYQRLFPPASRDDATLAGEVTSLIHDDLREAKLAAARALLASLPDDGRVEVDEEGAGAWLTALNDIRLAYGTAIGVTEESYGAETDDPDLLVYDWLSYLLESLVLALSDGR